MISAMHAASQLPGRDWAQLIKNQVMMMMMMINLYHSLGIFNRPQLDNFFLIFSRKQDLTLNANCLLGFDTSCKLSP